MRREEKKRRVKLWLLALALAIALTWYIVNPAPGPARQLRREDDGRDGERHQAHAGGVSLRFGMNLALQSAAAHIPAADDDLPEWPEYIEFD